VFARLLIVTLFVALAVAVAARTSGGAGPEVGYVVKPHDTLWSIAASNYGGDPRDAVWRIERRNHLDGALITPGQILRLP
jgi:nucleoid-associated protein YgaU